MKQFRCDIKVSLATILCFVCILAVGCGRLNTHITPLSLETLPSTSPDHIRVFSLSDTTSEPYTVLGKVYVKRRGGWSAGKNEKMILPDIKKLAAGMGADAIVGFYIGNQDFDKNLKTEGLRWGSGLAIKFNESGQVPKSSPLDFSVTIPRLKSMNYEEWQQSKLQSKNKQDDDSSIADKEASASERKEFQKDSVVAEERNLLVRSAAQFRLEEKGYYALLPDTASPAIDINHMESLDFGSIDTFSGNQTELILIIRLVGAGGANIGIMATADANVEASLYSKSSHAIVWKGSGTGSAFSGGLVSIIEDRGGARLGKAISAAVEGALESLPPARDAKGDKR